MRHKLDLLENAIDSLKEALDKFNEGSDTNRRAYKFAILHYSHFLELLFKYYVSKSHPLLIYKNPFSKKITKENTIGLWDAIQFLINEGKEFSEEFQKDLKWLKNLRNDIEHHKFEMDLIEAGLTLGRLIRATEEFNEIYTLISLSDYLDGQHLSKYEELCDEYKANLAKAKLLAKDLVRDNDGADTFDCLHCGESDTAVMIEVPVAWDKESRAVTGMAPHMVCQFCKYEDILIDCCNCGVTYSQMELEEWNEEHGDYICEGCLNNIYRDEW